MNLIIRQVDDLEMMLDSHFDNWYYCLRESDMVLQPQLSPESLSIKERRN